MKIGFRKTGKLYKGNTHLHTTISDGKMTPEEAFAKYRSRGYSFVVLTDHIRYFNSDRYNTDDLIVLPGVENHVEHDWVKNRDHHIVGVHDPAMGTAFGDGHPFGVPQAGDYGLGAAQGCIDLLRDNANMTIYAHPTWSKVDPEMLITLRNIDFLEIWNHESVFWSNSGDGTFYWDYLLRHGVRICGVASDDLHQKDDRCMGGFIMVQAEELSNESIARAMRRGDFYSSTGPEIDDFYLDGDTLHARCSQCRSIAFVTNSRSRKFWGGMPGESICEAQYGLADDVEYVRLEIEDFDGSKAWSNPIYIDRE